MICDGFVFFFLLKMQRLVPLKISSAVMESAWRRYLCATVTMIAGMPATRKNVRLPPVTRASSAAMTQSVSRPSGVATATRTARTSQTSPWSAAAAGRSPRNPAVPWASSSAGAGSAYTWTGSVTEMQTARISLMKRTAVSWDTEYCICVGWLSKKPLNGLSCGRWMASYERMLRCGSTAMCGSHLKADSVTEYWRAMLALSWWSIVCCHATMWSVKAGEQPLTASSTRWAYSSTRNVRARVGGVGPSSSETPIWSPLHTPTQHSGRRQQTHTRDMIQAHGTATYTHTLTERI